MHTTENVPRPPAPSGPARRGSWIVGLVLGSVVAGHGQQLTNIAQVRGLARTEAAQAHAVRVEGIVTFVYQAWTPYLFVQDATAGIFIETDELPPGVRQGARLRVEGVTAPGNYAPVINTKAGRLSVLGGGPLPPLQNFPPLELSSGWADGQWMEIEGVVRRIEHDPRNTWVTLWTGFAEAQVFFPTNQPLPAYAWLDAMVRMRGVGSTRRNVRGQMLSLGLFVQAPDDVQLIGRPTTDPFGGATYRIGELFRFDLARITGHRVETRGTVTLVQGDGSFFIQDETGGLLVLPALPPSRAVPPTVGDLVEASGFPAIGNWRARLEGAAVRVAGRGRPPAPAPSTVEAMTGYWGGLHPVELVTLTGRVERTGATLHLREEPSGQAFDARLEPAQLLPDHLRAEGALLRVTGVFSAGLAEGDILSRVQLLLRNQADVTVLEPGAWWTPSRRLQLALVVAAVAAVGALIFYGRQSRLRRRYEELFANAQDFIFFFQPSGRLVAVNPAWKASFRSSGVGSNLFELTTASARERLRAIVTATVNGERRDPIEVAFTPAPERTLVLECSFRRTSGGREAVILQGIARDLTALREAQHRAIDENRRRRLQEALLHLAESRMLETKGLAAALQEVLETATKALPADRASVWLVPGDDRSEQAFQTLECRCLWERAEQRVSSGMRLTWSQCPGYFAALAQSRIIAATNARTDPRTCELNDWYLTPLGVGALLDAPVRQDGHVVGVICHEHFGSSRVWSEAEQSFAAGVGDRVTVLLEAHALRQAEQSLREANETLERRVALRTGELAAANDKLRELDRLKSEFLASMSHELRTPLNSIIGFTGIVKAGLAGPLNDEQKRQLEMVFGSSKHLLSLINDLLDLSRIEAGRTEVYYEDFAPALVVREVERLLAPLAGAKGLEISAVLREEARLVRCDRKKFFQILLNVANNAVKFTEQGGVRIEAGPVADAYVVRVTDTGIGIQAESLPLLFGAFQQVDGSARKLREGTGLGLYLCRKLIDLLHGDIRVTSEFGRGSCFEFEVPLEPPPATYDRLAPTEIIAHRG